MRVFLSWSGERSKAIAEALRGWLPLLMQVEPWMSAEDIEKGGRWSDILGRTLEEHDVGIVCVTPENTHSPWLLFEAGALSKDVHNGKVFPLLLGMSPEELTGPLRGFQTTVIERDDMMALVMSLRKLSASDPDSVVRARFESLWGNFAEKAAEAGRLTVPGERATIQSVVAALARRGMPEPTIGSQVDFGGGFESHSLYGSALEIAQDRLWIFGRKNRKLFDKEHRDFLRTLPKRVSKGFDFRVLFLSTDAPTHVLRAAHADADFPSQLAQAQLQAVQAFVDAGLDVDEHCRVYGVTRTHSALVVDDAVLYSPVLVDHAGQATRLTKSSFSALNSTSPMGLELVQDFERHWASGHPLHSGQPRGESDGAS